MPLRLWPCIVLGSALALPLATPAAFAATPQEGSQRQTIEFSASASRAAQNDLGVATLYAESSGKDAAVLAKEINQRIARALDLARGFASVKARSSGVSTWPVYAKNGQGRIETWRMRSEIRVESQDLGALSELLGRLQSDLALSGVAMQPAPETRRKAVEDATVHAIQAFDQRAALIAKTMGKQYRIAHMSIGDSGHYPPVRMRMQAAPAPMADAAYAPAALEGGESELTVDINGRIELLD
jgi:predicted secreted protein